MSLVVDGERGAITVPTSTLCALVASAAEGVDGVRVRRGRRHLDVEITDGHARVRLELVACYGAVLPEAARAVQKRVANALATMCEVEVDAVDVAVEEVE
jgi:uncharacterized alkaline shock family protein YloU